MNILLRYDDAHRPVLVPDKYEAARYKTFTLHLPEAAAVEYCKIGGKRERQEFLITYLTLVASERANEQLQGKETGVAERP